MSGLRRAALGTGAVGRLLRSAYRAVRGASVPAPVLIVKPILAVYVAIRGLWYVGYRILVCEPLFKAYCHQYGRRLHTGSFVHWVKGRGRIIVGDDVLLDGKISFGFAARFTEHPTLTIGDRTGIGHGCSFTVGRAITIGADCRIAGSVRFFDSNGHPADPERRRRGEPPDPDSVKPITVADNVWIGFGAIVFPGVSIGEGSVVSAGSVVLSDVPANTIVAGNPARRIGNLTNAPNAVSKET